MKKVCKNCNYASEVFIIREEDTPFKIGSKCVACSFWETMVKANSLCGEFIKKDNNKEDLMIWEL